MFPVILLLALSPVLSWHVFAKLLWGFALTVFLTEKHTLLFRGVVNGYRELAAQCLLCSPGFILGVLQICGEEGKRYSMKSFFLASGELYMWLCVYICICTVCICTHTHYNVVVILLFLFLRVLFFCHWLRKSQSFTFTACTLKNQIISHLLAHSHGLYDGGPKTLHNSCP